LALVVLLRCWLHYVGPLPGDRYAAATFAAPSTEAESVRAVSSLFDDIANPLIAGAMITIAVWSLWRRVDRRTALGLPLASLAVIPNAVLKLIFGPTQFWASLHPGTNYPSGHAAFGAAAIGYLAVIGVRRRQPDVVVVAALLVIGMGATRVISGVHLVSDVLGGYMLGAGWLLWTLAWLDRSRYHR
jgi:membrane-associated phospholipid phosphatase